MSNGVATVERKGIIALLATDEAKRRITPLLRGVEYDRIVGEAYLAASENHEILECTPPSIVRAVARAVSWGLSIGEEAFLIPFNVNVAKRNEDPKFEKRLKAIQGYQGKITLILNAGGARAIDAQVVYAKELFEYEQGTNPFIKHRPARAERDRGELTGGYAIAYHGAGLPPHIVFMTLAEVDEIRKAKSKQWKSGPCPPWYVRKTCVHQVAKLLPKNARLAPVLRVLEEDEEDDELHGPSADGPIATIEAPAAAAPRVESGGISEEHDLNDRWIEESEGSVRG